MLVKAEEGGRRSSVSVPVTCTLYRVMCPFGSCGGPNRKVNDRAVFHLAINTGELVGTARDISHHIT